MTNKLVQLNAELDLVQTVIDSKYEKILALVKNAVSEITSKHNAVSSGINIRSGLWDEIEISFSIGFFNDEEGRVDFGSDMSFYYTSRTHELFVNYGTIGSWSKSNSYQIRRVQLISDVYSNIKHYEETFENICQSADKEYKTLLDQKYTIIAEIDKVKDSIKTEELAAIENFLTSGDVLEFDTNKISYRCRPFHNSAKILKICDKSIKVEMSNGERKSLNKSTMLGYIQKGVLLINSKEYCK